MKVRGCLNISVSLSPRQFQGNLDPGIVSRAQALTMQDQAGCAWERRGSLGTRREWWCLPCPLSIHNQQSPSSMPSMCLLFLSLFAAGLTHEATLTLPLFLIVLLLKSSSLWSMGCCLSIHLRLGVGAKEYSLRTYYVSCF